MISLTKYFSSIIDSTGHRIVKVLSGFLGAATADQVAPFGDDSCPVNGMDAIYAETESDELRVVIGYINLTQLAAEGEKRLFSLKKVIAEDGSVSYEQAFYTWHKNDGTYEMGGNVDNAVRYAALNIGLQAQIIKMEGQLTLIATAIAVAGGSYTPGDISLDISGAKIDEIKTL